MISLLLHFFDRAICKDSRDNLFQTKVYCYDNYTDMRLKVCSQMRVITYGKAIWVNESYHISMKYNLFTIGYDSYVL